MSYNTNLGNELHPDMQQAGVPHNANNTTAGNTMNSNNNNNHGSMGFTSAVVHQPMHGSVTSVNTIGSIPNAAPSGLIQPGQSMPLNQHHQLHQAHGAGNPINVISIIHQIAQIFNNCLSSYLSITNLEFPAFKSF